MASDPSIEPSPRRSRHGTGAPAKRSDGQVDTGVVRTGDGSVLLSYTTTTVGCPIIASPRFTG
jgi:hypothetical protein